MHLLIYDLGPDYLEHRGEFRQKHLNLAWDATGNGCLVLRRALQDPSDQTYLLFEGDSPEAAEQFARRDPYLKNGLVKSWKVRPWMTVVGKDTSSPVR